MTDEYEYLEEVLYFDYDLPKVSGTIPFFEDAVVRPRLEQLGFYGVNFHPSESNMFGPNTRVVTCLDHNGKFRSFIYN
jgi:hypothetical protein